MITSFADKATEDIYDGADTKNARARLSKPLWKVAQRKFLILKQARRLEELRIPPSNHLEKLKDDLIGYLSIRINAQYRIVFKWDEESCCASEVRITDYH